MDRGERDLHSEARQTGIRLGWGEAIFRRYWREWEKGDLRPSARDRAGRPELMNVSTSGAAGSRPGTGLGHSQGQGWAARDTARDSGRGPGKEEFKKEPYTPLLGRNPFTVTPESRPPGRRYVTHLM